MRNKRWDIKEEELLVNNAKRLGRKEGIELTSKQLDRSVGTCYTRLNTLTKKQNLKIKKTTDYKWEEISKLLVKEIKQNPGNIRECIKKVSEKTGYNFNTISTNYYSKVGKVNKDKLGFMFCMVGKNTVPNKKVFKSTDKKTKVPFNLWKMFKSLFSNKK